MLLFHNCMQKYPQKRVSRARSNLLIAGIISLARLLSGPENVAYKPEQPHGRQRKKAARPPQSSLQGREDWRSEREEEAESKFPTEKEEEPESKFPASRVKLTSH